MLGGHFFATTQKPNVGAMTQVYTAAAIDKTGDRWGEYQTPIPHSILIEMGHRGDDLLNLGVIHYHYLT